MTPLSSARLAKLNIEHWSVIILLLVAFFFRTYELTGLGLGLEHDEVAEWQIANNIRNGENALFFKEAYGQEPLFLYLMAGSITLFGDNVMAIRFTSVFVAMLTLAASYRLLRRMFSPTVALVALAGLSIALWPVFWGRVGLRAMTLPLMLALGFDWLWRGLTAENKIEGRSERGNEGFSPSLRPSISPSLRSFVFAGIFFGLSAYTYLSSRALPILLVIFTLYLALFARKKMSGKWRGLFVCFIVAGLIALPLVITLLTQPDLQFRVSEVSAPLDKALKGDSNELAANIPRAFGMFTGQGDTTVRDNWPNRPVFPGDGRAVAVPWWRDRCDHTFPSATLRAGFAVDRRDADSLHRHDGRAQLHPHTWRAADGVCHARHRGRGVVVLGAASVSAANVC